MSSSLGPGARSRFYSRAMMGAHLVTSQSRPQDLLIREAHSPVQCCSRQGMGMCQLSRDIHPLHAGRSVSDMRPGCVYFCLLCPAAIKASSALAHPFRVGSLVQSDKIGGAQSGKSQGQLAGVSPSPQGRQRASSSQWSRSREICASRRPQGK